MIIRNHLARAPDCSRVTAVEWLTVTLSDALPCSIQHVHEDGPVPVGSGLRSPVECQRQRLPSVYHRWCQRVAHQPREACPHVQGDSLCHRCAGWWALEPVHLALEPLDTPGILHPYAEAVAPYWNVVRYDQRMVDLNVLVGRPGGRVVAQYTLPDLAPGGVHQVGGNLRAVQSSRGRGVPGQAHAQGHPRPERRAVRHPRDQRHAVHHGPVHDLLIATVSGGGLQR